MSIDVEIYMNNIIKFFRENPNDLLNLVPKEKENEFYTKVRETAIENLEKGNEVSLTQSQMIQICAILNGKDPILDRKIKGIFQITKFGEICLN